MATPSSCLAWRVPWTEEPGGCSLWGHREPDATEAAEHARSPFTAREESEPGFAASKDRLLSCWALTQWTRR